MGRITRLRILSAQMLLAAMLGCSQVPAHPTLDPPDHAFSNPLVRAHMASIGVLRPRLPGSREDGITRAYLRREFELAGASTETLSDGPRCHLVAELRGESEDVILLTGPYSALATAEWVDDSSAGLLLELARVLGSSRPPYTILFALAEVRPDRLGPGGDEVDEEPRWAMIKTPRAGRKAVSEAGQSLARAIEADDGSDRVRAVIAFDTSARTKLRIARDLRSHPGFRRVFWQTAADLGFAAAFPADSDWTSAESLDLGFRQRSMDRVLALVDESFAHADDYAENGSSSPQPEVEFEPIGRVSVEALSRLMRRFEKVDAFSGVRP